MSAPDDDGPRVGLDTVGNDVVARAELRFAASTGADSEFVDKLVRRLDRIDGSQECIICHWYPKGSASWRRSTVGGRDVAICDRCSQLAVSSPPYRCAPWTVCITEPLDTLKRCIVLLATTVERACGGHDEGGGGFWVDDGQPMALTGQRRRIEKTFRQSWYAMVCNCPAHVQARHPDAFRGTYTRPEPGLHEVHGLALDMIRTFPDKVRYQGAVVDRDWLVAKLERQGPAKPKTGKPLKGGDLYRHNRERTAHPGVIPGGLADRALKAATQTNAGKWQDIHQWERENNAVHPAILASRKPDPVLLDAGDVDLLTNAFSREPHDARFYCDFCGDFHAVMKLPTGVFICASCRLDLRVQRLLPIVEAVRQGKSVTWLDHRGLRDE